MKSKPISLIGQDGGIMYLRKIVLRYRYTGATTASFKVTGNIRGAAVVLLEAEVTNNGDAGSSVQNTILQWVKPNEVPSIQWEVVNGEDFILEGVKFIFDRVELSETNGATVDVNA